MAEQITEQGMALTDIFQFARLGRKAQGEQPIMQFQRLVSDLPDQPETKVAWQVQGSTDTQGQLFLDLQVQASPAMVCQCCLKPVVVPVAVNNRVQVVGSEDQLDTDDDPDALERILGSNRFDIRALIEDELILALPYVPRHDVCPQPLGRQDQEEPPEAGRPSPFAVLGQLKKD